MSKTSNNTHANQEDPSGFRSLSVPTYRGSTILYPDYDSFVKRGELGRKAYTYGLNGTPTTRTLAAKLTEMENGVETFLTPSGLMAITTAVMAVVSSGDTILFPDNVYAPIRRFAEQTLQKFGVKTEYYDPLLSSEIDFSRPGLRMVWVESPGSITMEVQDIPAIVSSAKEHGVLVGCDNSWASPIFCKPLDLGADIVVEAVTKYLSGHSDLLLGSITVSDGFLAGKIHDTVRSLGIGVSPDDCFLALRGIESAPVRLAHIQQVALELAEYINGFQSVEEVLHPGLPTSPAHDLWKAQFAGSSGVFSFVMKDEADDVHAKRYEQLQVLKIGASWGGTHSLLAPSPIDSARTINSNYVGKKIVRLSVGLEPSDILLSDLGRFLA